MLLLIPDMKHLLLFVLLAIGMASAIASTTDPVADYKSQKSLLSTDTVSKWTADFAGNGHPSVFLSLKTDYDEDTKDGQVPSWIVYIASADGTSYTESTGLDEGSGTSPVLPQIDPNLVFVGQITQLSKPGLVTVQTDSPKNGTPTNYVYALTVESGHLKKTLLAQYSSNQTNAIYDQYLSDAHRTTVTLQQVSP